MCSACSFFPLGVQIGFARGFFPLGVQIVVPSGYVFLTSVACCAVLFPGRFRQPWNMFSALLRLLPLQRGFFPLGVQIGFACSFFPVGTCF